MALTFIGNKTFTQQGSARWILEGWELDRLIVPMSGPVTGLNAYLASLTMWTPSTIDGNMFLSDFPCDGHPQYPTVELTYIGKKNGRLPPDKLSTGRTVQQVSGGVFDHTLTYIAPTSTIVTFSRNEINTAVIGPREPVNAQGVWATVLGGISVYNDAAIAQIMALVFLQRSVATANSEELVPGNYYRAEITKTNLLFNKGFSA